MNKIEIEALPYDEEGVIHLLVSASCFAFSGFTEVYAHPNDLNEFGNQLKTFPTNLDHTVTLELGDSTGDYPYHLLLQAKVIDSVGHSAIFVHMQSFVGIPHNALAEFYIPAEAASINSLGSIVTAWLKNPGENLIWLPNN